MPYIGRDLNRGNYLKLDDISSSFNGSTQTFNLTVGGSAFTPGSAFSILVSVGGVIQEPESAYQVSNSEITFANAPTAQDSFFCIALGVALGIGVPGNGTVNGTQMSKPFNYDGFFYLNDGTNRVGINSSIPSETLDIVGNTKISGILTASTYSGPIVNASGISTFYDLRVSNNLTVEGTTTTLDTDLTAVDRIEVGANSNSVVGIAVTQSGTADIVNLFDGGTEIVKVASSTNAVKVTHSGGYGLRVQRGSKFLDFNGDWATSGNTAINAGASGIRFYYGDSSDGIQFNTGSGTDKVRITGDGKVGIGTDNPTQKVDIFNGADDPNIVLLYGADTSTEYAGIGVFQGNATFTGGGIGGTNAGISLRTADGGTEIERVRITSSGNVGIGTNNPKISGLHVDGVIFAGTPFISSGLQYGGIRLESNHSGSQSGGVIYGGAHNDVNHSIFFRRGYDGTLDTLDINEYGMFRIFTGGALGSQTERFRISGDKMRISSGISSISIGSGVDGQRRVDIVTGDDNGVLIRPTTGAEGSEGSADSIQDLIQLRNPWGSSAHNTGNAGARFGIQMRAYNAAGDFNTKDPAKSAAIYAVSEDQHSGYWKNVGLAFYTSAYNQSQAEKVRIDTNGYVGIGTSNPTAKLEILARGDTQGGIFITDSSASQAAPYLRVLGKRSDGNTHQNFSGRVLLASLRTNAKVGSGKKVGTIMFGGNHTDSSESNILYAASIAGVAGDSFDSATDMPTDLVFYTGSTGRTPEVSNVSSGEERLRIDSSGRHLIGSPTNRFYAAKLQVQGTSDSNYIMMHNTTAGDGNGARYSKFIYSGTQSGGETSDLAHINAAHDGSSDDQKGRLEFRINTGAQNHSPVEALRIDSSGRLQIGSSILTDYNQFNGPGRLNIQNNNADGTVDFSQGIVFTDNVNNANTWTHAGIVATGSSGFTGSLVFGTDSGPKSNSASGITEKMRITKDGNVGIGTNNPVTKLHVESTTGTATYATISHQKTYGSGTGTAERSGLNLAIREANTAANNRIFGRIEVGTNLENDSSNGFMSFFTRQSATITEKLRIASDGKVGIGTDNPVGKLHIWSTGPDILLTDSNQATDNRNWILTGANTQILRLQAQNDSYAGGGNLFDLYRSGNELNEFRGMSGGNYWFTIDNDTKKVGIGTVNPDTPLHIYANDAQQITVERASNANSSIRFRNTVSSMFAGLTSSATGFAIDNDDDLSSGPMFFVERSTGNIGVNCTPTALPLEVKQQSADGGALRLRDSSAQYRYLEFDVTGALTQITARSNNSHGNIDIGTLSQFGRRSCLHIDSSGLVGINTNDPEKQLHVYHTSTNYIAKFESADSTVQIGFFDSSTTNGTYIGAQSENLILYTNGFNERLYVDSNGNIGISAVPVTSGTLYDTVDHFLVIGDSDTGIAQDGDGQLEIWANNQEVANFTNIQATFEKQVVVPRMGIGVAPTSAGDFGGNSARLAIGDSDTGFGQISDGFLATYTNGVERLRITNVGRIWIGNPNGRSPGSTTAHIQLEGADAGTSAMSITRNSANSGGPQLIFNKTRGTSVGADTVVNNGDTLGILHFVGSDGNDSDNTAAMIVAKVDGSVGSNDVPGRLQFETKTDGGSFTEKLRIHNDAKVTCYGLLQIPNTGTGIKLGPGDSVNDDAHIEWLGGNNAGYLRISISDDSDSSGTNEYIEIGDYAAQNRGGDFTQHVRISRDQFLVRTGSNTITQADRFKVNSQGHIFMPSLNTGSSSDDVQYGSSGQLIVNASTRLVKTDIEDCSYGLAEINQLKPRIYKRTDADNKVEIGFIADEVQSILPEIVSTKEKSFFTKNESDTEIIPSNVDLKRLTVILTKAIQEQQEQIETLKSKVAALEGS